MLNRYNKMYAPCVKHDKLKYKDFLFSMFNEITKVLNKSGIKYWSVFGTCLGAVRENRMIIWDDDIDIAVKRNDYKKLVNVIRKNCAELFVWDWSSDEDCTLPYGRVFFRVHDNMAIEKYRAYVDIFIIDRSTENDFIRKLECVFLRSFLGIISKRVHGTVYLPHRLSWNKIIRMFLSPLYLLPLSWTHMAYELVVRLFSGRFYVQCPHEYGQYSSKLIPLPIFESSRLQRYEGFSVPVPKNAEEYLEIIYGDWRTPPAKDQQRGYAWNENDNWIVAMPMDSVRQ